MKLRWKLVLLCLHVPAWAASSLFEVSDGASRIESVAYRAGAVVRVSAVQNHPFLVEFDPTESIEGVAIGQPAGWEVVKHQSRLFVRALPEAQETTLIAISATRSYIFELVPAVSRGKGRGIHRAKIVFTYERTAPPAVDSPPAAEPVVPSPLAAAQATPKRKRNFNYTMQIVSEQDDIRPQEVFDDGVFTYFRFPRDLQIPSLYKSTPGAQQEWLVNTHVEGEFVVAHTISPLWILRLQGSTLGLFNESYRAGSGSRVKGTPVPGYRRVDK